MAIFVIASLAGGSSSEELVVFCAASLTGAFGEMGQIYEDENGVDVMLNFDGTQAIRTQVEQGAIADVFISANKKHMDALMAEGFMDNDTVSIFTENRMVVIVPADNPADIQSFSDLAEPGVMIITGVKDAPFGSYTLQVLDKLANDSTYGPKYREAVMSNVISQETSVSHLVSKIALGEADAGFAYQSDISPELSEQVSKVEIPDQYSVVAEYPLGRLKESENPDQAARFIEFVRSTEGRAVLEKYGFQPV
ncbi:molybdate ABC transporter substrate-binding protein [Methanotrichaceae archaeon M04Ac]|uniref:Molybdate ABC transporter substrate-binding protein n=1 Tax=Candidatus Methanocrinis alkalitolerans TaxID=3033395 RepID=A0ABT5XET5_9EURY|nr:molybdate ABC transporter substrate-binding protein [Candidatus Methanocrinis alkalitolerans]MCR3883334.1 molybdate ABC transporter substrate-binding protein [Methanothrix sp.]MDF0593224.1 molybdate ABC transporter substrate-binding protein [Candidatus Methanocrinis alkalitolerans]